MCRVIYLMLFCLLKMEGLSAQFVPFPAPYTKGEFDVLTIDLSRPVGVTPATAAVNALGAATYNVPLQCAPGTQGMQPQISLQYNMQEGNGLLGMGWSLQGLSAIGRSGADYYHDGTSAPVTYTAQDAFILDGQRLVLAGGIYAAAGSSYRMESENFAVLLAMDRSGNGPQWFRVTGKDGSTREYGRTADARLLTDTGRTVMLWLLNRIRDADGNYISFSYTQEDRDVRIAEINYTGHDGSGGYAESLPYNRIRFFYRKRPDPNTSYDKGFTLRQEKLLDRVEVYGGGTLMKKYQLHYAFNGIFSLLKYLEEAAADGSRLNATHFRYGDEGALVTESDAAFLRGFSFQDILTADFNGDGLSEIFVAQKTNTYPQYHTGYKIWTHNTSGGAYTLAAAEALSGGITRIENTLATSNNYTFSPADFNGDGRDDIVISESHLDGTGYVLDKLRIRYGQEAAGLCCPLDCLPPYETGPAYTGSERFDRIGKKGNYLYIGDFNGDAYSDFLLVLSNRTGYNVFFSSPAIGISNRRVKVPGSTGAGGPYAGGDLFINADAFYVLNFDGDAKNELMRVEGDNSFIYKFNFSGTDISLDLLHTQRYPTKKHDIHLGDFNGDGKTDLLTGPVRDAASGDTRNWTIAYSDGNRFRQQLFVFDHVIRYFNRTYPWNASTDKIVVADLNGDGKSDIYDYYNKDKVFEHHLYLSSGTQFSLRKQATTEDNWGSLSLGDFNGDGKQELINATSSSSNKIYSFFPLTAARFLQEIRDGLGRITEFDVAPISGSNTYYRKGSGAIYPLNNVQLPYYVTTAFRYPDGTGMQAASRYRYEDLKWHRNGRGLLGFGKLTRHDQNSDLRTETHYGVNTRYYVPQLLAENTFLQVTGQQLTSSQTSIVFADKGGFAYEQRLAAAAEQNLLTGSSNKTEYSYDDYGNVTRLVSAINAGLEQSTVTTSYTTPAGALYPVLPVSLMETKQRQGQVAVSKTTAYTYSGWHPVKVTDFAGEPVASEKVMAYDRFGNVISEQLQQAATSAALWPRTEFFYDTYGRFRIAEKNPLGQMSYSAYDPLWAKLLTETGVNGNTTTYRYDAWGKLIETELPGPYMIGYSDGWDISGTKRYYTMRSHPGAADEKTAYDELERPVQVSTEAFGGAWTRSNTVYDSKGNVLEQTAAHLDTETPERTINTYDQYQRMTSTTTVAGTTTYRYSYSGGATSIQATAASGQQTEQCTDAAGKLISSGDHGGKLYFTYDSWGNQLNVRHDARSGPLIVNRYDAYGRKISMTDIDAGTTSYTYNYLNQLNTETDAQGNSFAFTYDLLGRLTERKPLRGTYASSVYTYYGAAQNNALQQVSIGLTRTAYRYDHLGRMTEEKLEMPGKVLSRTYSYDAYSRPERQAYSSGLIVSRSYDTNGYLKQVAATAPGMPVTVLFNAKGVNGKGQYTSYTLCNGISSGRKFRYGIPQSFTTPGIQDLHMDFDLSTGNLLSRKDKLAGLEETFAYDRLDRLIKAQVNRLYPPFVSYLPQTLHYDASATTGRSMGNISAKSDAGTYYYSPIVKVHAVQRIDPPLAAISHQGQEISYTVFNKAATIKEGVYEQHYAYDALDERCFSQLSKDGVVQRQRWYFGDYETDRVLPGGSERQLHYISGGDGLCAVIVAEGGSFIPYAIYTDHLGSILRLTDVSGALAGTQEFDAWGRERYAADWNYVTTAAPPARPDWLSRGFTGHEMLSEFALVNMNARLYDPVNARMLRPDDHVSYPANTQSYNRFSYALNNPLRFVDPDGNDPVTAAILIGVAAGMWSGGAMANGGQLNPGKWDYASGRTWGYMLGGGIAGGISGGLGASVAAGGGFMANTLGIMAGSVTNALGTAIYTGGRSGMSMSFGIGSYNFTNGSFNGLWNWPELNTMQKIGYGFGALANLQDLVALNQGIDYQVNANVTKGNMTGHSAGYNQQKTIDISVAGYNTRSYRKPAGLFQELEYLKNHFIPGKGRHYTGYKEGAWTIKLNNVNGRLLQYMHNNLAQSVNGVQGAGLWGIGKLSYGFLFGCQSHVGRSLLLTGIPTLPVNFHPWILNTQLLIRQTGIYAAPVIAR